MTQRIVFLFGFIIVLGILGTGFYLEYFEGILPCPLCTLQRICFGICGILFLLGFLLAKKRVFVIIFNLFSILFSAAGLLLAARQIWIQSNPTLVTGDCGVSLNYMLSALPITDVANRIFSGSTECSQRGWELLNMNIPEWSFIFFGLFLVTSMYYLCRGFCKKCRR